jgi:hypothetical protein
MLLVRDKSDKQRLVTLHIRFAQPDESRDLFSMLLRAASW